MVGPGLALLDKKHKRSRQNLINTMLIRHDTLEIASAGGGGGGAGTVRPTSQINTI